MKKLLSVMLAALLCFGACALAEDEWVDYQSIILNLLYDNVSDVMESDASRVVATAAAVLDYALAEPTAIQLGGGEQFFIIEDGGKVLFICPVMDNDVGAVSAVLYYPFDSSQFSMRTTTLSVASCAEALSENAGMCYELSNDDVASAAQLLVDALTEEE